jgi:hypothetical protein
VVKQDSETAGTNNDQGFAHLSVSRTQNVRPMKTKKTLKLQGDDAKIEEYTIDKG